VPKLKIEGPLWNLIAYYSNFQNILLSFRYVGYGFFFLLVHFDIFLEASYMIISSPIDLEVATFGYLVT